MKISKRLTFVLWLAVALGVVGSNQPLRLEAGLDQATTGSRVPASQGTDLGVVNLLRSSLSSPQADARAAALQWIARDARAQDDSLIEPILAALQDPNGGVRNEALANMGWVYSRHQGDATGQQALAAILQAFRPTSKSAAKTDSDAKNNRSAPSVVVDLLRGGAEGTAYNTQGANATPNPLLANSEIQSLIASLLKNAQSTLRPQLLGVVADSAMLQANPAIVEGVGACLTDDNLTVRSNSVDLLIAINHKGDAVERHEAHPLVLTALREGDPNVQLRASRALGLPIPPRPAAAPVLSLTGEKVSIGAVPFDFNYFTAFVQPLFVKNYRNEACVNCHTPQANASGSFRILAPAAGRRYTLQQSRLNFASVLSVIDERNPERSRLLLKPLDPRTQEGDLKGMEHDGGVFWANQYDPDFEIVLGWLKGAKLETPPEKQLDFAYFAKHVEPVFSTPGSDGVACINCHSTHAILHLLSPATREGQFSVEQLVNNYQAAHRVVDEAAPANSFIVRKPTSLREGEPGGLSHAGGIRWPEKTQSWQYKALITWIGMPNLAENSSGKGGG
ncbi:MAG TPA: hypothetical protein VG206_08515 [Terriglobia bacterium]|nr:hypothetical protein [Terriglobia bacterium]